MNEAKKKRLALVKDLTDKAIHDMCHKIQKEEDEKIFQSILQAYIDTLKAEGILVIEGEVPV